MSITEFKIVPLNHTIKVNVIPLNEGAKLLWFSEQVLKVFSILHVYKGTEKGSLALEYECNLYTDPTVSCLWQRSK